VEEVTDEPLYRDRVCGIDIGKAGLVATIWVPSDRGPARRAAETIRGGEQLSVRFVNACS
jgi:transposase